MLTELAKPVALTLCILSLYAVFHSLFLATAGAPPGRLTDSLPLLLASAGISLASGILFRDDESDRSSRNARLSTTLPVQMFGWSILTMTILFLVSWYLETHFIPYRDPRLY